MAVFNISRGTINGHLFIPNVNNVAENKMIVFSYVPMLNRSLHKQSIMIN